MKIKVLFFSVLQDVAGSPEIEWSLAAERSWTVAQVLVDLYEEYEGLKIWDGKILLAVDQQYVDRGDLVEDGQELAIMPPVQGG